MGLGYAQVLKQAVCIYKQEACRH